MADIAEPIHVVADLDRATAKGERFAVLAVFPSRRCGDGCQAVIASLHVDRAEAERVVWGSSSASETCQ